MPNPGDPAPEPLEDVTQARGETETLLQQLHGSSIEDLLRIQEQLSDLVRERYERTVAVMFSDIAGSTAYFERHGDTAGRRLIQRSHDLLVPLIERNGGRVVKTIGDAVMATFTSAQAAVEAAIAAQLAVDEMNIRTTSDGGRFEVRIGINWGSALVNDKDGDVYGDSVNLAARVQSQARPQQILISDAVRMALSMPVPLRPAGRFVPKGKNTELEVFEICWTERGPRMDGNRPNLGARYQVQETIGAGGMATVWRARDLTLERDVAIKVLHPHVPLSSQGRERFQREAKLAGQLTHENIVQVFDWSGSGNTSFLAMELVAGESLRTRLDRSSRLPPAVAVVVAHEVARALAFAHSRGIVHRDVKPDNVLLSQTGAVKLSDFGIATFAEAQRLTLSGIPVGTPAYVSPEQLKGEPGDTRSDLYALGVVLYEMLAGQPPFRAENLSALMFAVAEGKFVPLSGGVDAPLSAIVSRAIHRDPKERFQSADELRTALAGWMARHQLGDPRTVLVESLPPEEDEASALSARITRRSGKRIALATLGGVIVLAAAVGLSLSRSAEPPAPSMTLATPTKPSSPAIASPTTPAPPTAPLPVAITPPPHVAEPIASTDGEPDLGAATRREPSRRKAQSRTADTKQARAVQPEAPVASGTLKIVTQNGWADVFLDGKKVGRTPVSFSTSEGPHQLALRNPFRATVETRVDVKGGASKDLRFELKSPDGAP